jgi:hypothetical protein
LFQTVVDAATRQTEQTSRELTERSFILDKGKPVARRGRKAMGPANADNGAGRQAAEGIRRRSVP